MFAPKLRESDNTWQFRDIQEMAQYANTSPVLLDADASMVLVTIDISLLHGSFYSYYCNRGTHWRSDQNFSKE